MSSCVGTIKDANKISTKADSSNDRAVSDFSGISSATAVSNTRVEVTFPASVGDIEQLAYVIRYDGQVVPTYVYASTLRPDYRGLFKYTVTDLRPDTRYSFTIQARNMKTNVESSNSAFKITKTFSNATANFNGISVVRNLSGADGLNGIEVLWSEAEIRGGLVNKDEIDPIEYQVTVINANSLNPGDMNNSDYAEPARKIYSIQGNRRSATINGLQAGTKYYVQVRAIHYGYSLPANASNIYYLKEQNTNYLEISTYSDDLSSLNFTTGSFTVSFPPGNAGLYSTQTDWITPQGNFDHYRIFYSINGMANLSDYLNNGTYDATCSGPEDANSQIKCQFVDSNVNSFLLTGLDPNTAYNMAVVVCLTRNCEKYKRMPSQVKAHTTTPPIANFRGISSIDTAMDITKLDRLYLNFSPPDFSTGNIAGLIVEYYGIDITNQSPVPLNDSDNVNTTLLDVQPFDFRTETRIEISGIDPSAATPYCFLIIPFTYNNDGSKNLHRNGLVPQCKIPQIKGPAIIDFDGIDSFTCNNDDDEIIVNWDRPESGVYDSYELYYSIDGADFNFGEAFNWMNNGLYRRILVPPSRTTYTITNLQPGRTYRVGIITFYDSINGPIRSEVNAKTIQCSNL